ncbi:unnamed protein product [Linum trigynum]|uniref:Uncharacterized protein n=1 Tax=Linum trigynum TaxID=586398 RepID=A0AAV2DCA4_9ROSI
METDLEPGGVAGRGGEAQRRAVRRRAARHGEDPGLHLEPPSLEALILQRKTRPKFPAPRRRSSLRWLRWRRPSEERFVAVLIADQ